jgi:hypothetical protein
MNTRSCQRGMADRDASRSERRDRKNDVDMMSNCQPCWRAMASACGTFGISMKPKRSHTRRKLALTRSIRTRSSVGTCGLLRVVDGEHDILFVQHLIMFEAVQERGRRTGRIAGQEHCRARYALRRPPM